MNLETTYKQNLSFMVHLYKRCASCASRHEQYCTGLNLYAIKIDSIYYNKWSINLQQNKFCLFENKNANDQAILQNTFDHEKEEQENIIIF